MYAYFLSFVLMLRLLLICQNSPGAYFTTCGFFFFMVVIYCIVDRKRYYLTIAFIICILPVCIKLDSNMLMVLTLMLILFPISFRNLDLTKGEAKFLHFFVPITLIVLCQLIGYKNLIIYSKNSNATIKTELGIDLFCFSEQTILDFSKLNEYNILKHLIVYLLELLGYIKR